MVEKRTVLMAMIKYVRRRAGPPVPGPLALSGSSGIFCFFSFFLYCTNIQVYLQLNRLRVRATTTTTTSIAPTMTKEAQVEPLLVVGMFFLFFILFLLY
jgi:hypothetical protein